MQAKTLLASGALVLGMLVVSPAQAVDPATLANTGTGTVVACASCHGKDGADRPRSRGWPA